MCSCARGVCDSGLRRKLDRDRYAELALDEVQPGAIGGGEVQDEPRVGGQPALDRGVLCVEELSRIESERSLPHINDQQEETPELIAA
jgi:hypothetical protein